MTEEREQMLDIDEVLKEDDLFKLAIRGHAAIEELMNAAIDEAFRGNTPGELRSLPFRIRLALFRALTQLPKKLAVGIESVAKLRNEFAHGRLDDVSPERAKVLADALGSLIPAQPEPSIASVLAEPDPRLVLKASIRAAYGTVEIMADLTRGRREQERKGLKALKFQANLEKLVEEHRSR